MDKITKKITANYFYNLSFQIFSLIVPLITTPYISRVLGAEMLGVYSYTLSVSTYFILAGSLGFPLYGQREIAYRASDIKERSILFFQLLKGQLFLLSLALVLFFCYVIFMTQEYTNVYLAQSVGIVGSVLATSWFYTGIEEFKVTTAKNFFVKILSVIGLFLFVKKPDDVVLYACIIGGANILGNLSILIDIRKYVDFKYSKASVKDVLKHIKPAFILGIPYYITSLYTIVDKTMLGLLGSGYSEVGYYEQSQKIVTFIMAIVTSVGTVIMPRMAHEIGNLNLEQSKKYLNQSIEICLLLAMPICVGLILSASLLVPWFFGNGYERVVGLLIIFSPLVVFMGISNLIGSQYMVVIKKEKELTVTILIGVVINCILNAILIPIYDSYGAALSTILSEIIKLLIQIMIIKEVSQIAFFKNFFRYAVYALLMGLFLWLLKHYICTESTIFYTFMLCVSGTFIYGIILFVSKNTYIYIAIRTLLEIFKRRK